MPQSIPIATIAATPRMLHNTCFGFKSERLKLFFGANVVSKVGQKDSVMLVMYAPANLIGAAQLKSSKMKGNKMFQFKYYLEDSYLLHTRNTPFYLGL